MPGLVARSTLYVACLSTAVIVSSQDWSSPPYDAGMPDSVSFPVDREAILNETDELQHRPFSSATYTYHAGVFDVHANDTEREGSTMISNGVFAFASLNQSLQIEKDFWRIVDGWESLATERWATPVLGVGHSRVFHTVSANGQRWPWRERLLTEELEDFQDLGFKHARLAFQWTEAEPNWEQLGLQYMYLEYLSEVKRLNSGINPRLLNYTNETHFDDLGVNEEYIIPTLFSSFVRIQGYNVNAGLDPSAMNSHSRPPGSIFPGINYTALAPGLEANWKPDIKRGVYFETVHPPIVNETVVNIQHVNTTNHTSELEANVVIGATDFATPWADGAPQTFYLPFPFTVEQLIASVYRELSVPAKTLVRLASTGTGDGVMREFASSASKVHHDDDAMLSAMNLTLPVVVVDAEAGDGEDAEQVVIAVPEPEPENRTIWTSELAGVCACGGSLPPGELCREYVPQACLEDDTLPFCEPCLDALIDSYEPTGACPHAISTWVASHCDYDELQWDRYSFGGGYEEASTDTTCEGSHLLRSDLSGGNPTECAAIVRAEPGCGDEFAYGPGVCACVAPESHCQEAFSDGHSTYRLRPVATELPTSYSYMQWLPKPDWMDVWDFKWYQQRQQWWDAQRKRYRPQVWTLIDRLSEYGIYTTLDFRPEMHSYVDCTVSLRRSPIKMHMRTRRCAIERQR